MTNRSMEMSLQSYEQGTPQRGFLRIAIPSWRSVGLPQHSEPEPEKLLSREEIQSLFKGDLDPRNKKRSALTSREEQERSLALRLRKALYPEARQGWSH
ncbi:MAG: hypothetical protein OEY05_10570 [Paracoccaceae bacterium]|nr:hypothetical protein [Paracoccaceae bacterium]